MHGYVFNRARDEVVCHFMRAPPGGGAWEEDVVDSVAATKMLTCVMSLRPTGRATLHGLP